MHRQGCHCPQRQKPGRSAQSCQTTQQNQRHAGNHDQIQKHRIGRKFIITAQIHRQRGQGDHSTGENRLLRPALSKQISLRRRKQDTDAADRPEGKQKTALLQIQRLLQQNDKGRHGHCRQQVIGPADHARQQVHDKHDIGPEHGISHSRHRAVAVHKAAA